MKPTARQLRTLEPGQPFRIAGARPGRPTDAKTFLVVEHLPSATLVRETKAGEQIEFTRSDGTAVDFQARKSRSERWAGGTMVEPI